MKKRNNKISRKRSEKALLKTQVIEHDGTEVLVTKEARAKARRWTFEADITLTVPQPQAEDEPPKMVTMPMRTLKLQSIAYGSSETARADCKQQEEYLRSTNNLFATAKIKVRAIPHETVSNDTMRQLSGYRDMCLILDKALELCITQGGLAEGEGARTLAEVKEGFYNRARNYFSRSSDTEQTEIQLEESERKEFVPEIVEIERVSNHAD